MEICLINYLMVLACSVRLKEHSMNRNTVNWCDHSLKKKWFWVSSDQIDPWGRGYSQVVVGCPVWWVGCMVWSVWVLQEITDSFQPRTNTLWITLLAGCRLLCEIWAAGPDTICTTNNYCGPVCLAQCVLCTCVRRAHWLKCVHLPCYLMKRPAISFLGSLNKGNQN